MSSTFLVFRASLRHATVSQFVSNVSRRATIVKITHTRCIRYFCSSNVQTQSIDINITNDDDASSRPTIIVPSEQPKPTPSKPKMPVLKKVYNKETNAVSYVLHAATEPELQHKTSTDKKDKRLNNDVGDDNKEKKLTTNALTEYLPSRKKDKDKMRDKELKSLEQSLMRKYGTQKSKILKEMRKNFFTQKYELSKEIMNYFKTIPKLEKLRHKFTHNDLSKLLTLQQALQISPTQYRKVLKRYPYILKMDVEKEIVPRFKALQQIFPHHDTLKVFIRAPNIIATETSTWLVRRDKINQLLGIRKDVFVNAISQQPTILFNSVIKTTGPKIRFLCDRVRSKFELQAILHSQPSILKVGWGRLARIEFLRSSAVPTSWQTECSVYPPNTENILGDNNDDDLEDLNDAEGVNLNSNSKIQENLRRVRKKEREMAREWHLNRPCVSWNHAQMKQKFPKYRNFLEEFTLRAKKSKMWTVKDLQNITHKEMEEIIGEALRKKYSRRKIVGVNWDKKEQKQRINRRLKKMRKKMSETPSVEKPKY